MKDEYDFSDAKRGNPFAERILQNGYVIVVNCGVAQDCSSEKDDDAPSTNSVAEYKAKYSRESD